MSARDVIGTICLAVLLISFSISGYGVLPVSAPPVAMIHTTGFVSPVMSDIRIDEVNLNSSIVLKDISGENFSYVVREEYRFEIENPENQNATLMLAHAMTGNQNAGSLVLEYSIDGESENYSAILYQSNELLGRYDIWARNSPVYDILNITLEAHTSVIVGIDLHFDLWAASNSLDLGFAASDSLPWDHSAAQIIELSVFNATAFHQVDFEPSTGLSTSSVGSTTTATWHLNMTTFAEKYVVAALVQNPYQPPGYYLLPAAVTAVIIVLVLIVAGLAVVRILFKGRSAPSGD